MVAGVGNLVIKIGVRVVVNQQIVGMGILRTIILIFRDHDIYVYFYMCLD